MSDITLYFFSPSLFFETKLSYGYTHIERIYKDIKLQKRIVRSSKIFWSQVMIPKYFLMRIPQRLLPIIFSLDKEEFFVKFEKRFLLFDKFEKHFLLFIISFQANNPFLHHFVRSLKSQRAF